MYGFMCERKLRNKFDFFKKRMEINPYTMLLFYLIGQFYGVHLQSCTKLLIGFIGFGNTAIKFYRCYIFLEVIYPL